MPDETDTIYLCTSFVLSSDLVQSLPFNIITIWQSISFTSQTALNKIKFLNVSPKSLRNLLVRSIRHWQCNFWPDGVLAIIHMYRNLWKRYLNFFSIKC